MSTDGQIIVKTSWLFFLKGIITASFLALLGGAGTAISLSGGGGAFGMNTPVWIIVLVAGLLWLLNICIQKAGSWMALNEDHVMKRTGIISKSVSEVRYENIRSIDTRQGVLDRIFGIGAVMIGTAGTSGYEIVKAGIKNPDNIKQILNARRRA